MTKKILILIGLCLSVFSFVDMALQAHNALPGTTPQTGFFMGIGLVDVPKGHFVNELLPYWGMLSSSAAVMLDPFYVVHQHLFVIDQDINVFHISMPSYATQRPHICCWYPPAHTFNMTVVTSEFELMTVLRQ